MLSNTITPYVKKVGVVISIIIVFVLLFNLLTPYFIIPSGGTSMKPTANCGVTLVNENPNSIEEGDIVMFQHSVERFGVQTPNIVQHRVYDIMPNYHPQQSTYVVTPDNHFVKNDKSFFGVTLQRTLFTNTYTTHSEAQQLENETVYITKGDNFNRVDPLLLQRHQILGEVIGLYNAPKEVCNVVNPIFDNI